MKHVQKDDSLTLHTDLYQINMLESYWADGTHDKKAVFELFFRKNPFGNGYAVFAGVERIIEYISGLRFTETDIDYLREMGYEEDFLAYLQDFKFEASIESVREGEIVFANETLVRVTGKLGECQLVETMLLNIVNFQTLIATKASRISEAVGSTSQTISEFGTRRAQEADAALWGTRAAYIGGFHSTSNVRAGKLFGIPVSGTHAHAMVQTYRDEYKAFKSYAKRHKNVVFLVDTYDTLKSGVPTAIRVAQELGDEINFVGIRLDSGNLSYLSKKAREMLDEAGFTETKIYASNDLDEHTILKLKTEGAKIDAWGIGTKLITAYDQPALGGVYKLVSIEDEDGNMVDTIKLSESAEKITTPGLKNVYRIINKSNGKWEGDYITMKHETPNEEEHLKMFHPVHVFISKFVTNFEAKNIHHTIFDNGELVYDIPSLEENRAYREEALTHLWSDYKSGESEYPVDLSQACWDNKMRNIEEVRYKVQLLQKK